MKSIYSFTVNTTEEVEEKTKEKRENKQETPMRATNAFPTAC